MRAILKSRVREMGGDPPRRTRPKPSEVTVTPFLVDPRGWCVGHYNPGGTVGGSVAAVRRSRRDRTTGRAAADAWCSAYLCFRRGMERVVKRQMRVARLVISRASEGENLLWALKQAAFRTDVNPILGMSLPAGTTLAAAGFGQVCGFIEFGTD
jgi:hypothetical protein